MSVGGGCCRCTDRDRMVLKRKAFRGENHMNPNDLRMALKSSPFHPFLIRMADGRTFEIHHPDFLLVGPDNRIAFAYPMTGGNFSMLDIMLMTELSFDLDEAPTTT
jgi:hypothetical protein